MFSRYGEGGQYHLQLLQVQRGCNFGLFLGQSGHISHPLTAPPWHCHICRKCQNILVSCNNFVENTSHSILRCGNKYDQKSRIQITDSDMEAFCEQCHNLVSGVYKTSCKTGEGVEEMFKDIASQLAMTNRSRMELQAIEETSFQVVPPSQRSPGGGAENSCGC